MNLENSSIGSAKDNLKSPVHNWYKFTAGFSYQFVDEIIKHEGLNEHKSKIFDPFAGCGTTLVSTQKLKIPAVGNEGQRFMYEVILAKLNWSIEEKELFEYLELIENYKNSNFTYFNFTQTVHPLLQSLYDKNSTIELYLLRDAIEKLENEKYRLFLKLALSQTLHKTSLHPIAVPYISRNKNLSGTNSVWSSFVNIAKKMLDDCRKQLQKIMTSKIYLHDSRLANPEIHENECSTCITSPPYLNNLDYGEVSKVHTHFYEITRTWNDITQRIRKQLVTGSTTHYSPGDFDLNDFKQTDFYINNKRFADALIKITFQIRQISQQKSGRKSFDILTLLYFKDMYEVLKEIRRVTAKKGKTYLILGDSAPYGVYIPTTEYLGIIGKRIGLGNFKIHKIRSRGTKWKSLTHRHSLELSENILIFE